MNKTAVYVMGGGRVSRMAKYDIPKPLLPLNDMFKIIDYQYELYGRENVFIVTGYKADLYGPEHKTVHCSNWNSGIIDGYKTALKHAESHGFDRLVLVDGDVIISEQSAKTIRSFDCDCFLLVHEKDTVAVGLSGYTMECHEDKGYLFDINSEFHFGCIVNLHKETLKRLLYEKAKKPDLFVECLYGENFVPIWEGRVYLEIDTDEDYQKVKDIIQNGVYFWLNRNPEIHYEAAARLHGGPIHTTRLRIETEYLHNILGGFQYGRVLDLGSGTGELLPVISQCQNFTYPIYATDINEMFVKEINWKKIPNVHAVCLNLMNLEWTGIQDEKYDLITMLGLIQYIIDDLLVSQIIEKCYTLLNDGGHIVIRNSTGRSPGCRSRSRIFSGVYNSNMVTTRSEDLDTIYSSYYRSAGQIIDLFNDNGFYSLLTANQLYPKELDSKHGTRQYYFTFRKEN